MKRVALILVACAHARAVGPAARFAPYRSGNYEIVAPIGLTNEATEPGQWAFVAPRFELTVGWAMEPPPDLRAWLDPSADEPHGDLVKHGDVSCATDGVRALCVAPRGTSWVRAAAKGQNALDLARGALESWKDRSLT